METSSTVFVALLGEGVPCWRPAAAIAISESIYRIEDSVPEGESWEFQSGQLVKCELRSFPDGSSGLVAVESAPA